MITRSIGYFCLLVILALVSGGVSAQGSGWRVESPVLLNDLLADGVAMPHQAMLAPDGRQVAYEAPGADNETRLCVYDIPQQQERCVSLPPEYRFSVTSIMPALRWSPDSTAIATVGVPYFTFRDTDLGIVDLTTPNLIYTNVDNDDYSGNFALSREPLPPNVTVPSYPAFSPDSTQIAFERAVMDPSEGQVGPAWLSIVDLATGAIRDLTRLPGQEVYQRDMGTVVGLDWSPDGTTLAVSMRHPDLEPDYDGIWLLDIASNELNRLFSVGDLEQLASDTFGDLEVLIAATPLRWSPDGSRLMFWLGNPGAISYGEWLFWIDIASGEVTPAPLSSLPSDTANFPGIWPLQATWSPDGSQILMSAHLPDPPADPLALAEGEGDLITALYLIDVNASEAALLGHLPLAPSAQFSAAWGPENDVIIAGYRFKLVEE